MLYATGLGLLVLSWWQPMHLLPWASWHSEILAFISNAVVAMAVLNRSRLNGENSIGIPWVALPFLMLIPLVTLQWLGGLIGFSGDFLVIGFYVAMGFVALVTGFNLARATLVERTQKINAQQHIHLFASAVLVGAIGSVILALAQALLVWDDVSWIHRTYAYRRPGGNLGQPNQLATLILMGMGSLAYLYESVKISSKAALALLCVLILGLAVTESRSGALDFMVLAIWWDTRRRLVGFSAPRALVVFSGVLLIGGLWVWPKFLTYIHSGGLEVAFNSAGLSLTPAGRLMVWPQLIEAAWQRPWLGWGLGEVGSANNTVVGGDVAGLPLNYAHNIVLDLLIGMGVPITLLFTVMVLIWLRRRLQSATTLLPWYGLALLLPVGGHSMFEFPYAYAYFLLPAMLAIGMVEGTLAPSRVIQLKWRYAAWGVSVLTAAMVWSAVEYFALEEDYRVVRFEALKVGQRPVGYERPNIHLLSQLAALNDVSRSTPMPGMRMEQIEVFRKVAMRYPWFATQNRYALSLALNGRPEEAIRQLKVMRAMHGELAFSGIRTYWTDLAQTTYPQLRDLTLP